MCYLQVSICPVYPTVVDVEVECDGRLHALQGYDDVIMRGFQREATDIGTM